VTPLEGDTRIALLDPALHAAGWTEELIRREETPGAIEIVDGRPRRAGTGRTDYTLRIKVAPDAQPVAVAVVEAKRADAAPTRGLDQAKEYAREYARSAARLHVPFVFSTNGHQWVEFDATTGLTTAPAPMADFPSPNELRVRWEAARSLDLTSELARPLSTPYHGGETSRRYYQDAAIRAVLEKIARGETRALLSLATGAGKTYIAVHLLRRLADAGLLRRALFLVDRDELRNQALGALQNVFGADAAAVSGGNPQMNARVLVATYQTLGLDRSKGDPAAGTDADADANAELEPAAPATFLEQHYPPDYFNFVIIDECHRSGWGDWSTVLTRNSNAVQVGLTATPRQLTATLPATTPGVAVDAAITADNLRYFGDPVYEYELGQGIEDGYLAACEIVRRDIFLEGNPFAEREPAWTATTSAPFPCGTRSPASSWPPPRPASTTAPSRSRTALSCRTASARWPTTSSIASSRPADRSRRRSSTAPATAMPTTSPSPSTTATPAGARRTVVAPPTRTRSSAPPPSRAPIPCRSSVAPPATTLSRPPWSS